MTLPSQRSLFYTAGWNEETDDYFLCCVLDELRDRLWSPEIPTHALLCAQALIQRKYNVHFAYNDILERFIFLKKRYETYTWLVRHKDTAFDISNNIVNAPAEAWARIFQQNELAKAYYTRGEPQFTKLQLLFGLDKVIKEEEPSKIIVELSDTVSPTMNAAAECVIISDTMSPNPIRYRDSQYVIDDDEVTSPLASTNPASRRRLFDEESRTNTLEEAALPPMYRMPRAPKFDRGESSCASSSPIKWFKP